MELGGMKHLATRLLRRMTFLKFSYKTAPCLNASFRRYTNEVKTDILFSGIQPTSVPHLGNYLGAIKNWVALQDKYSQCIFSVVDMHALTKAIDPKSRREHIINTVISLLACGVDPSKCILFQQSDVKEHAELCWIFTCMVTESRLKLVPQWKEKAKQQQNFSFGLIAYPLLMSADILLYKASYVPVGSDQIQQMQLCRDIAKLFNNAYGIEFFPQCEYILTEANRIKSLRNPELKMSKSDPVFKSRIDLDDDADTVRLRFKQAITDNISEVYHSEERPGVSNLIDIHSALTGLSHNEIRQLAASMDTGQYKLYLADVVNEYLDPIRSKIKELKRRKDYVQQVLDNGKSQATEIASKNLDTIKSIIGLK